MHPWFSSPHHRSLLMIAVAIVTLVSIAWVLDHQHRAALRDSDGASSEAAVQSKQLLPATILDRENLHDAHEVVHDDDDDADDDDEDDPSFSYRKRRHHRRTPKPSPAEYAFALHDSNGGTCGDEIPGTRRSLNDFEGFRGCINYDGCSLLLAKCYYDPTMQTTTVELTVSDGPCMPGTDESQRTPSGSGQSAHRKSYTPITFHADDAPTDKFGCFLVQYEPASPLKAWAKVNCPPL